MLQWKAMMAAGLFLGGMNLAFAGQGIPEIVRSFFPNAKQTFHAETEVSGGQGQQYMFVVSSGKAVGRDQLQALAKVIMAKSGWNGATSMPTPPEQKAVMYMHKSCILMVTIDSIDSSLKKGEVNLAVNKTC